MNPDKLKKLQANVRIGGKGTARRKKKIVHKASNTDDKKLQSQLKKLSINPIPGIEEVNMFRDDGSVIHFTNPKVQASPRPTLSPFLARLKTNRFRKCSLTSLTSWDLKDSPLSANSMEKVGEEAKLETPKDD